MAFISTTLAVRPSFTRSVLKTSAFGAKVNKVARTTSARVTMGNIVPAFTKAMAEYKEEFPQFADRGWGATTKAERWNGRHAMFGLFTLVVTGYCQGHGLLPDPSVLVDVSQWGPLVNLGDYSAISQSRAIILVAHIHVLFVSVAAAIAPFSFQDKLLLDSGEADEEPAGLIPKFAPGFNKEAELWNSRFAMLGVICLVFQAAATHTPIMDVVNLWLGNRLF